MNEIQLIRAQLAAERAHAASVAEACLRALERQEAGALAPGSALFEFRAACIDYLAQVLTAFEERDQRLGELLQAQAPARDSDAALLQALAQRGRGRETLEKLAAAGTAHAALAGWRAFLQSFHTLWNARREAIDALLAANQRVSDWRAMGGVDADSILDERRGYARVCALLPAGVLLPRPAGPTA
jgi:hypothetical protein